MKYYIKINWNGELTEVNAKTYHSRRRNPKNSEKIIRDKTGKKEKRILTILA